MLLQLALKTQMYNMHLQIEKIYIKYLNHKVVLILQSVMFLISKDYSQYMQSTRNILVKSTIYTLPPPTLGTMQPCKHIHSPDILFFWEGGGGLKSKLFFYQSSRDLRQFGTTFLFLFSDQFYIGFYKL